MNHQLVEAAHVALLEIIYNYFTVFAGGYYESPSIMRLAIESALDPLPMNLILLHEFLATNISIAVP
jgi:hypothetical protein